jgi:hypothetical protein
MKLYPLGANMTEIEIGNKSVLFSYKTPVAVHIEGMGYVVTEKHWSTTTSRHINKFLGGFKPYKTESQEYFDNLI